MFASRVALGSVLFVAAAEAFSPSALPAAPGLLPREQKNPNDLSLAGRVGLFGAAKHLDVLFLTTFQRRALLLARERGVE